MASSLSVGWLALSLSELLEMSEGTCRSMSNIHKKGYQGFHCNCKACQVLTDEERLAKQERIHEARRQGGKARAAQESMAEARTKAFWTTMDRHPFYARKYLRHKIKAQSRSRMIRSTLPSRPAHRRQPLPKRQRPV